jgi:hypothetical protein
LVAAIWNSYSKSKISQAADRHQRADALREVYEQVVKGAPLRWLPGEYLGV